MIFSSTTFFQAKKIPIWFDFLDTKIYFTHKNVLSTLLTFGKSYIGSHFMKFIIIGIFCSLYKHFLKLTFLWRFKKIVSNLGFKCQSSTRNRFFFLMSLFKKKCFNYYGSTFEAFRVIILEIVKGGGQNVAFKL